MLPFPHTCVCQLVCVSNIYGHQYVIAATGSNCHKGVLTHEAGRLCMVLLWLGWDICIAYAAG